MTDKLFEDNKEMLDALTKVVVAKLNNFKKEQKNLGKEPPSLLKIFEISKEIEKSNADQATAYLNSFYAKIDGLASTSEQYKFIQQEETKVQELASRAKAQRNGYERKYHERLISEVIQPRLDRVLQQLETEKRFPEVVSLPNEVSIPVTDAEPPLKIAKKQKPLVSSKILLNLEPDRLDAIFDLLVDKERLEKSDKELFIKVCYNEATQKLVWKGNANIWGTVLYDLKSMGCIKSKKNVIAAWMTKNFQYEDENVVKDFDYESSYAVLNSGRRDKRVHPTKAHHIDILNLLK